MDLLPNQILVTFSTEEEARTFASEFVEESNGLITAQPPTNCSCCDEHAPQSFCVKSLDVRVKKEVGVGWPGRRLQQI
jgi:hypothetical protein